MTDFSDAALRERADVIGRKCGTWDAVPSEAAMRFVAEECYHAFIALRDAARAEMNIVKNRALEALTEQLIKDCDAKDGPLLTCPWCTVSLRDTISLMQIVHLIECGDVARADLAVPCQRHGCMWDAPEAHEECRAEQRETDARKADEYAGESARLIAAAIRAQR